MELEGPIGVIDSGVGGLSVVEAIRQLVPTAHIVYVADPLHFPYGEKTRDELMSLVRPLILFLESLQARMVVTACGTVSSLCLEDLRREFSIPIVGILDSACRDAIKATKTKKVMVLATRATVEAHSFRDTLQRLSPGISVTEEAWPELIMAVEKGLFNTSEWREWVKEKIHQLRAGGVDVLILGCTHFALIEWFFADLAGKGFAIINPARSCAGEVKQAFASENMVCSQNGRLSVIVRGNVVSFRETLEGFPLSLRTFELVSFPVLLDDEARCVH